MRAPIHERRHQIHMVDCPRGQAVKKHRPGRHCHQSIKVLIAGYMPPHCLPDIGNDDVHDNQQAAKL